jgi:hypothetical protein
MTAPVPAVLTCSLERCPECGKRLLVLDSQPADMLKERGYATVAEILQLTGAPNIRVRQRQCLFCGTRVWSGEWALYIQRRETPGGKR